MAGPRPLPLTLNTLTHLIETFTDFLIVSIHAILHLRSLYPPSTFITTCKYNFAVPQQRHPDVCKWILDACLAVQTQLFEGIVRRVIFVIYQDAEVIERWIFDVDRFPVVPKDEASIIIPELAVSLVDIEEQLRATMKRLEECAAKLTPLPKNCAFTILGCGFCPRSLLIHHP
jgi:mitotic spindle assembly checkpoint protein MAD2B